MRQAAAYVRWAYGHLSRSQRDAKEPAEYLVGRICEENSCHRTGVRGTLIFLPFTTSVSLKARPNTLNIPGPDEDTQAAPEQRSALF